MSDRLSDAMIVALLARESQADDAVNRIALPQQTFDNITDEYAAFNEELQGCPISLCVDGKGFWRSLMWHPQIGLCLCEGTSGTQRFNEVPLGVLTQCQPLIAQMREQRAMCEPCHNSKLAQLSAEAAIESAAPADSPPKKKAERKSAATKSSAAKKPQAVAQRSKPVVKPPVTRRASRR